MFNAGCDNHGIPHPISEYHFAIMSLPGNHVYSIKARLKEAGLKDWRLDFSWPPRKLAVEVDGGAWTRGRHTRGRGFIEDQRKRNAAIMLGWRVLHYTPDTIDFRQIKKALMPR